MVISSPLTLPALQFDPYNTRMGQDIGSDADGSGIGPVRSLAPVPLPIGSDRLVYLLSSVITCGVPNTGPELAPRPLLMPEERSW